MFKTTKENKTLKTVNEILKDQVEELQEKNAELQATYEDYRKATNRIISKTEKELSDTKILNKELKSKLRPQTEADILLNALKAVGIIKEEKPKEFKHYQDNNALLQQQLNAVIQSYPQSGQRFLGGAFGGVF